VINLVTFHALWLRAASLYCRDKLFSALWALTWIWRVQAGQFLSREEARRIAKAISWLPGYLSLRHLDKERFSGLCFL
jgi:hypothetical protein